MKKNLFSLIFLCFFAGSLPAQISKGDAFLGGGVNLQIFNNDQIIGDFFSRNSETVDLRFSPTVGFLVSDKLAVGGSVTFSFRSTSFQNPNNIITGVTSKSEEWSVLVGPLVRYYAPFDDRLGFRLDMGLQGGLGKGKEEVVGLAEEIRSDLFEINLAVSPGFYYFVSPRFSLEATFGGVGYNYQKLTPEEANANAETTSSGLNLALSSGLGISLRYFFQKGEE